MPGTFQDLRVWQQAVALAIRTYRLTRTFPKDELYGLVSQMRRAAVSVPSNIAEGKGRVSDPDAVRFLGNARGSLFELRTQVIIARGLDYMDDGAGKDFAREIDEIGRQLNGLIDALRSGSSVATTGKR